MEAPTARKYVEDRRKAPRAAGQAVGGGYAGAAGAAGLAAAARGGYCQPGGYCQCVRAPRPRAAPSATPPPARPAAPSAAQRPAATRAAPGAARAQQEAEEAAGWRVIGPRAVRRKAAPASLAESGTAAVAPPPSVNMATTALQDDQCLPGGGGAAQEDEAQLCDTCCEAPATAVLVPCGHNSLKCCACAERWRKLDATKPGGPTCPLCRALVRGVRRAF
ncbi:hypothetical protein Rsub_05350 [Raphidocelis subcapitata]|uniref:RING-type domain-containing protein n=1 Tax=Raphidocelis subcapitata TaxID=307507 RepID=A0A2V0P503_9CHLO|nr:hypothetical protein Rsub_05350 [Raphidocelis subcapitata]|eukprot:GBF92267.1 hypothetical protein Rsub_05350 [Raphidocelis subcapitata]